jgi:hypothetical protein
VRLPVTASKLNKSFASAGKGAKKRAIVEGFAEEIFFRGGCKSSKKSGSKSWRQRWVIGKTLKFDKT